MRAQYDEILINATILQENGNEVSEQAIAIKEGKIAWCGPQFDLNYDASYERIFDCKQQLVTPGLIDCHTHLVYSGNRANEFKMRLAGASYGEIAAAGGGILSTVFATRQASKEELFVQSLPRLEALRAEGVTTVEIKSGYGLDLATEIKMLEVARALGQETGVRVKTTFLGAHCVPPEYKNNQDAYVDFICETMLPTIAEKNLADAVDVFCESIAFNIKQTEKIFTAAARFNLPIKCHADQLTGIGASALAASMSALSCDHLEYLDSAGLAAMAKNNTVAVLLPGAFYFLKEQQMPPIEQLRKYNIPMAIATDCNPGTSPTSSLQLMMSMACCFFSLTVNEVLAAVTINGARALGIQHETGSICAGKSADLVLWSLKDSGLLCYHFGARLNHKTMIKGQWLASNK